ncbi:MAG: pentapeptide repeat-containing protein [Spirochaetales bacterium]|nr:pentapeptide repeat-containing protein [Spirochaetales bacterium]
MKILKNIKKIGYKGYKSVRRGVINPFLDLVRLFFASTYRRAALAIIPFLALLFFLDYHVFLSVKEVNWISIVARVHGIFFDIVLLGLFLLIFELLRGRKRKIDRYREELEDIFFWNEKEGILKKAGIIRRLSALGAKIKELSGIVLAGADINKVNLEGATLEGADLSGVKLNDSLLNRIIFTRHAVATKQEIIFSMETRFTRISGAELNNARICDAECACMDFSGIQMMYAKLNRTNLKSAVFHKAILRFAEMKEALLEDADFSEADLYRATFKGADLQGSFFSRDKEKKWENGFCAQLSHTDFENANLNGALMNHVDMSHACCKKASMMNTKLKNANLGWVNFENSLLIDADLHDADMNHTILKDANLAGANLRKAKNLTLEQVKEVKTLYQASLDDDLLKEITKNRFNHLFKWPEEQLS